MVNKEQRIEILEELQESLQAKNDGVSSALLPRLTDEFQVDDWAWLLESLTNEQRVIIWPQLEGKETSSILAAMRDDARQQFVSGISSKELSKALADSTAEEAIEVIDVLPQKVATRLIKRMTKETQAHIKANLNYDEDQVGRYANHDVYTIPTGLSVGELRAELKSNDLPDYTDSFLIVDEDNKLLGEITINELFSAEPEEGVMGLSHFPEQIIKAEDGLLDASNQLKNTNKSMLPVVTEHGELLGRFDVNDALIVFQQHYEEQIAHLGKVSDEDLFAPAPQDVRVQSKHGARAAILSQATAGSVGQYDPSAKGIQPRGARRTDAPPLKAPRHRTRLSRIPFTSRLPQLPSPARRGRRIPYLEH